MSLLTKVRHHFWPKRGQAEHWRPEVPPNERIYAVGDIHGRADLLVKLHKLIQKDAQIYGQEKTKKIIYLGDYIDRGLESKTVIDILLTQPLQDFQHIFLKGNHEDLLLRCIGDPQTWPAWIGLGGAATALSYGARLRPSEAEDDNIDERMRQDFLQRIPLEHRSFLEGLQLNCRSGDYLFVHAGVRPHVPLEQQDPQDLMWIREDFLRHKASLGVVVVHGHSISLKPEVLPERIGIDTGAYATNALSCIVLDGPDRRFLSTGPVDFSPDG
jgi:serine/threonine protein phosphatase 1